MPPHRYRIEDLHSLRASPLISRPQELPDIHQWIDPPNDQRKQRKNEDSEDANKRPNLTNTRNRQSQSGEIFLGPKVSFASASAANKQPKDERSVAEELKAKVERIGRERPLRERDNERGTGRREPMNGQGEDGQNKHRTRRDSAGEAERARPKPRQRQTDGDEDDAPTPRRTGFPEKLNKPWFREGNESPMYKDSEKDSRSSGREFWGKENKHNRHEQKPSWMGEPLMPDQGSEAQTQQDFAAWKEAMKKQHGATTSVSKPAGTEVPDSGQVKALPSQPSTPATDQPIFGLWGQTEADEVKQVEPKKPDKAAKKSRFFSTSVPKEVVEERTPESPKGVELPISPVEDDENRRGFQNIMQMLRAGGSNSQPQINGAFQPPGIQIPQHLKSPAPYSDVRSPSPDPQHPLPVSDARPQHPPEQKNNHKLHNHTNSSKVPNRDSELLLNLIKQQKQQQQNAHQPFQEGNIYGQNYNQRRDPGDVPGFNNGVPSLQTRPPPGFHDNGRAFASNGMLSEKLPDELPMHHAVGSDERHHQSPPEYGFPPQPHGEFGRLPLGPQQRPPSHEAMAPPPGFHPRPSMPPGFPPQFGPGHNGPPGPLPPMRGPPPMHFNNPPPGFGPQSPPGIGPGPQPTSRRAPSQSIPPGFEMYGDPQRRQGAPYPQPGYPQYLNHGGGPPTY